MELGVRRTRSAIPEGCLKPRRGRALGRRVAETLASASRAASCSAAFFELPLADAELLAVDDRRAGEVALVRRPLGREDDVGDLRAACARAPPGAPSCGRRGSSARSRSAPRTRSTTASSIGGEAVLEEERAEHRLEQRREDVAVLREPLELVGLEVAVCARRAAGRGRARARRRRSSRARRRASGSSPAAPPRTRGSARRARARSRARARCRRGTRAARTTSVRSAAHDECVNAVAARSGGSASISGASCGDARATGASRRSRRPGRRS